MAGGPSFDPYSPGPVDRDPAAASKVKGPATALMVVGGINILAGLYNIAQGITGAGAGPPPPNLQNDPEAMRIFEMVQGITGPIAIVLGLVILAVGGVIIFGGLKMKNLESPGLTKTASVLAMIPCISCCIIGLPIGIWSLTVLSKPDVSSAFRS